MLPQTLPDSAGGPRDATPEKPRSAVHWGVAIACPALAAGIAMGARHQLAALAALRTESENRDRAERALRRAQKLEAMGQLTGGVAHDFNNLLMVMGNNVHLLRRLRPELADDARLAAIARAVGSGEKLTRQLVAFSRRQALRPQVLRLQDVLPALVDLIKPAVGSRVQVATSVAPDTAAVELDPAELALNARDAMPGGGQLTITARDATDSKGRPEVVLSVSDTGQGIPPELQERVFEPFFTTKPVGEGTGLGLSQVYGMCTQAGGTARIESRPGLRHDRATCDSLPRRARPTSPPRTRERSRSGPPRACCSSRTSPRSRQ